MLKPCLQELVTSCVVTVLVYICLNFQRALIVFYASEELAEISLAKPTTSASLLSGLTTIRLLDSVLTAYPLNNLQKQRWPVAYWFCKHL